MFFTVVASPNLPVHICSEERADEVYDKHAGTELLGVRFIKMSFLLISRPVTRIVKCLAQRRQERQHHEPGLLDTESKARAKQG